MRTALATFVRPNDERLRFIRQLGVEDVIQWGATFGAPSGTRESEIDAGELLAMKRQIESHGMRLYAVETLPAPWYGRIITGGEGAAEQIVHFQNTIRAVAAAGVPILGYNWFLHGVWRTSFTAELRGGARGTAFDIAHTQDAGLTHGVVFDEKRFWENYTRFLEAVIPVAVEGRPAQPLPGQPVRVPVVRDGRYDVELWNTFTGAVEARLSINSSANLLTVPLPEIRNDLALKCIHHE
jgi:mannonate dehydratase